MCHKVALKESPAAFPLRYALAKKARAVFIFTKNAFLFRERFFVMKNIKTIQAIARLDSVYR